MATSLNYIEYVCDQISGIGEVRYRKMFGEYMIYLNDKPIIIVCNGVSYVKQLPCIEKNMITAEKGYPYTGAKEHYVLDIDNSDFSKEILLLLEKVIPVPKSRAGKKRGQND